MAGLKNPIGDETRASFLKTVSEPQKDKDIFVRLMTMRETEQILVSVQLEFKTKLWSDHAFFREILSFNFGKIVIHCHRIIVA